MMPKGILVLVCHQCSFYTFVKLSQFVQRFALNIRLIEIFYQKLLHMLTFDRAPIKYSENIENPSTAYENLARMVHKFKNYVYHLQNHHKENKSETHTVEKCSLYISEVMIQAQTRAGYCYWKLNMKRSLEVDLVPPKIPNSQFFQLLNVQQKSSQQHKKESSSNIFKLGLKDKEESLLVVSEKYDFLFQ